MTIMTDIISELEALRRSTESLEVIRKKAEAIRKKLNGKLARGCKLRSIPSNYSLKNARKGTIPTPYWVKVYDGQTLDLITAEKNKKDVVATVKSSSKHSGSSVITLVKKLI